MCGPFHSGSLIWSAPHFSGIMLIGVGLYVGYLGLSGISANAAVQAPAATAPVRN
ncbi:hypothetical protein [Bosea sp. BIWAKO-01]|uniref:hypothetical protein n=1 Tax=Bosea sp. BIWAKO-01 TaxID=506668 RepID=UPI00086A1A0B|nr:hypothetical protein [Bosea sp. BIWAKO-01]GAU86836.1 hypothetical protein BIWAKO_06784 [Bosea sp. BIWAKO-01]